MVSEFFFFELHICQQKNTTSNGLDWDAIFKGIVLTHDILKFFSMS